MADCPLSKTPHPVGVYDRRFRHELFSKGAALLRITDQTIASVLLHENRKRRRKPKDDAAMRNCVSVIIANLAHSILFPPEDGEAALILPLGHARRSHIDRPQDGFGEALPALLESLRCVGVLILARPREARLATTITPSLGFRRMMLEGAVSAADIGRRIVSDLLRLSRREADGSRTYFAIPDTPQTDAFRDQMRVINADLAAANIAYRGNDPVDVADRILVRRFSHPHGVAGPSLDYGGRLCGGFWQNMPKQRRRHLLIDGEPVAELDYGQVFLRLAYGLVGEHPPEDSDLYALPGLERHRGGVKMGCNALLWGAKRWNDEIASALPDWCTAKVLRTALMERHPALAHLFGQGRVIGHRLMHLESAVIVAVLMLCSDAGIVALPIHDAVLVPASTAARVKAIMEQAALSVGGVFIPATLKV